MSFFDYLISKPFYCPKIKNTKSNESNDDIVVTLRFCQPLRFCQSDLWARMALLPGTYPKAIQEKDFVVPGEGFACHDGRRNLTDLQETSQWLGGSQVPNAILSALLGH